MKVHDDNRVGVETGASVSSVLDPHQNMSQQSTASRRCSALDSSKSFPFPSPSFQEVSSSCVGSTRKVKGHRSQNGAPLKLSTLPLISEDDECSQCLHSDFRCDEVPSPSEIPKGSSCETPKLFNGYNLMQELCRSFLKARTSLGQFCRMSLQPIRHASKAETSQKMSLWPVPPPRWCWTACNHLGPQRRRRRRRLFVRHQAVQLIIASLNWEVLGIRQVLLMKHA